jgi:DNA polymerase-3 subunit beta
VPRKGVGEISRLSSHGTETLNIGLTSNFIRVRSRNQSLTVKLIDGKFPDYERVLPRGGTRTVIADREVLRAALQRTSILSNEKFRGVRLHLSENVLRASAHNPEQEEAEEEIAISYDGESMEIGFNVSYLLDVLTVLASEKIRISLSDSNSSSLLCNPDDPGSQYVVMPMRL